jgi:hypothetical protein
MVALPGMPAQGRSSAIGYRHKGFYLIRAQVVVFQEVFSTGIENVSQFN